VGGIFVGLKIELLLILLSFGWGAAAQTLVATSLGAGKPDRAAHEERLSIAFAFLTGVALTVPVFVFSKQVAAVFNPEPELIEWAETYIKLMALAFLFTPINVVISQSMVSRNRLRIPVVTDTVILLGILTPTLIIAALAGATPRMLIILNGAAVIALTLAYVVIRQVVLKLPLVPWKGR
jgi:Na+-driven multidrug efflux pump